MYDDVHNNYYNNLTKNKKEWFDEEGYLELVVCDKCGLIQSWNASETEKFIAREILIGKRMLSATHMKPYTVRLLLG